MSINYRAGARRVGVIHGPERGPSAPTPLSLSRLFDLLSAPLIPLRLSIQPREGSWI